MHNGLGLACVRSLSLCVAMSPDVAAAARVRGSAQWIRGRKRSRYYLVYTSQRGGEINCARNPVCSENADELHENLRDPRRLVGSARCGSAGETAFARRRCNVDGASLFIRADLRIYFRNYACYPKVSRPILL